MNTPVTCGPCVSTKDLQDLVRSRVGDVTRHVFGADQDSTESVKSQVRPTMRGSFMLTVEVNSHCPPGSFAPRGVSNWLVPSSGVAVVWPINKSPAVSVPLLSKST